MEQFYETQAEIDEMAHDHPEDEMMDSEEHQECKPVAFRRLYADAKTRYLTPASVVKITKEEKKTKASK